MTRQHFILKLEMNSEMQTTLPQIYEWHSLLVDGLNEEPALGKGFALIPFTASRLSWNPLLNSRGSCFHGHQPSKI